MSDDATNQLERWRELLKELASLMRELHKKGFEIRIQKIMRDGEPYIKAGVSYRTPRK